MEFTEEQRRQLESGKAVDFLDSQTTQDSDWTADELRLLLARSSKDNGWEEPAMDAYDRYDEELRERCP